MIGPRAAPRDKGPSGRSDRRDRSHRPLGSLLAAVLALAALVAAACAPERGLTERPVTTTEPAPASVAAEEEALTERSPEEEAALALLTGVQGQLAVGQAGALSVVSPDGSEVSIVEDGVGSVGVQPVWSTTPSVLAWSRTTPDGSSVVIRDLISGQELVSTLEGPPAFYLQWSGDDRGLLYLRTSPTGVGVEMGLAIPGQVAQPVAATDPFYVAWSPTGSNLAAHVGNAQVIVLGGLLDTPLSELSDPAILLEPTGGFAVPVWLDDTTLLVTAPEGLVRVDVLTGVSEVVAETGSPVRFVVSPDRSRVAYNLPPIGGAPDSDADADGDEGTDAEGDEELAASTSPTEASFQTDGPDPGDGLAVIDLASGEVSVVTDVAPLAWEWSPDSELLAWLDPGLADDGGPSETRWTFWDGEANVQGDVHLVSPSMIQNYVPFFEQYSLSHTQWSPDSTAFAYTGSDPTDGRGTGVWVQLVGEDLPAVRLGDGEVVTWSP